MRKYAAEFIKNESGVETMEWICIVAVAAALIAICAKVASKVKTNTKGLADTI